MRYCIGLCVLAAACAARPAHVSQSVKGAYETALTPFRDGFALAWYDSRDGNGGVSLAWTEYMPSSVEVHQGTAEVFFTSVP